MPNYEIERKNRNGALEWDIMEVKEGFSDKLVGMISDIDFAAFLENQIEGQDHSDNLYKLVVSPYDSDRREDRFNTILEPRIARSYWGNLIDQLEEQNIPHAIVQDWNHRDGPPPWVAVDIAENDITALTVSLTRTEVYTGIDYPTGMTMQNIRANTSHDVSISKATP